MSLPVLPECGFVLRRAHHAGMPAAASIVPELACASFERLTGLNLSIHDLQGRLWGVLGPARFQHLRNPCIHFNRFDSRHCQAFDIARLRPLLARHPAGLVKRCRAGVVEVAVATAWRGEPWLVLFAGAWRAGPDLHPVLDSGDRRPGPWDPQVAALPVAGEEDLAAAMELLHQLGGRLQAWREGHDGATQAADGRSARRKAILDWIQAHHREDVGLADLADALHLSRGRASHAVTEACGAGFARLLADERLRTASEMLRTTDLPVPRIVSASGFRNRSHFHQVFRRHLGTSPQRWRRMHGA